MLSFLVVVVPAVALVLVLRWAFFVRLGIVHAPYCPVCQESRGQIQGVGEQTNHPYFRCPHCGNVWDGQPAG